MKRKWEQGFTLIELLVVVAIIGILAAIAIPQYAAYKRQAADADAKSNLHNLATAMEAYYGSNGNTYQNVTLPQLTSNYGYRQSQPVSVTIGSASSTDFELTASSVGGNGVFTFNSNNGQMVGS